MRTIKLFLLVLLVPMISFAKKEAKTEVNFLGVDFSCVDIVGAEETEEQFHKAFNGINTLLSTEADKFDAGKYLNLTILSLDTKVANERIELHKFDDYLAKENKDPSIDDIIKAYPTEQGNYLLIIASEFNKSDAIGSYIAVVFDGESKTITSKQDLTGKSKGFGLRNYWAGSLYASFKSAKKRK